MGCCTNLLDFCRRTGIDDCFERFSTLHFIGPDGTQHDFAPSRWLPAPLHLLPGLMKLKYLSAGERWGIVRSVAKSLWAAKEGRPGRPIELEEEETMGEWLRRQGQSERAIERFWSVVLVERAGRDGRSCLAGRGANGLPQRLFGLARRERSPAAAAAAAHDLSRSRGQVARRSGRRASLGARRSEQIEGDRRRAHALVLADGTRRECRSQ